MSSIICEFKTRFSEHFKKGLILDFKSVASPFIDEEEYQTTKELLETWYSQVVDFNFLDLTATADLNEIFIHGPTEIKAEFFDQEKEIDCDLTSDDLYLALSILAFKNQISWNLSSPFVSFQAQISGHHTRVSLTHPSLSPENKVKAFLRFHNSSDLCLSNFNLSSTKEDKLTKMMKERSNILVAGATGSGKTTFLNSMLAHIPKEDHTIILEDTFELKSPHAHTTRMLADKDLPGRDLNTYMGHCMRMSPKRIILGEMRAKEVEPFLLAMNTGHKGTMSTVHANSAKDALDRLALLFKIYSETDLSYELVLKLVTQSIDYVIFVENKQVKEIIQVFGSEHSNIFYELVA